MMSLPRFNKYVQVLSTENPRAVPVGHHHDLSSVSTRIDRSRSVNMPFRSRLSTPPTPEQVLDDTTGFGFGGFFLLCGCGFVVGTFVCGVWFVFCVGSFFRFWRG